MASSQFILKRFGVCLVLVLLFSLAVSAATYYVDDDAPNDPGPYDPNVSDPLMDGSADHPFDNIQEGIDAAIAGDTVMALPGTYYEDVNFNGKNIILTSTEPNNPSVAATTIIHGVYYGSAVTFAGSETADCKLYGLTITQGNNGKRGGIKGNGTTAEISYCTITGNGHGLEKCNGVICHCTIKDNVGSALQYCHGTITDCTILRNSYAAWTCNATFEDCTIRNNSWGMNICDGMIANCTISGNLESALDRCDGLIINCIISENDMWFRGALQQCDGMILNCTIRNNHSDGHGGGISDSRGTIMNCSIIGNRAFWGAGLSNCTGQVTNCIIWGNRASISDDQLYDSSTPTYSCIQDWTSGGTGNITNDPLFADADNGDYHLKSQAGRWDPGSLVDPNTSTDPNDVYWTEPQWVYDDVTSPCIDTGDPASDWTAELWPHGGRINMGAYGGTPEASMSANPVGNFADLDHDDTVGAIDLELFCEDWLQQQYLLDTDLNRNGMVDIDDFADFAREWLWIEP